MGTLKQANELKKRINKYVYAIHSLYQQYNDEAAKFVTYLDTTSDPNHPFTWKANPVANKMMMELQKRMTVELKKIIVESMKVEWGNADAAQDAIIKKVMEGFDPTKDDYKTIVEKFKKLYSRNDEARDAFINRQQNGLNLSQRCWNLSEQYKESLESALSCGIEEGISASKLSKRITDYLLDFTVLRKEYKQRFGAEAKGGDCEYRAMRLARTEINMAYREAEQERWNSMWFIVGYEIKLSSTHDSNNPDVYDICDRLKGKYPKDFKWNGWHPNCKCYQIPIRMTREEQNSYDYVTSTAKHSKNEVKDVPIEFKQWVYDNSERIADANHRPYFITDNPDVVNKVTIESLIANQKGTFTMTKNKMKELAEERDYHIQGILSNNKAKYETKYGIDSPDAKYAAKAETFNNGHMRNFDILAYDDMITGETKRFGINIVRKELSSRGIKLTDEKGFTLNRTFSYDEETDTLEVFHDLFTIPEGLQGKGVSKNIMKKSFRLYQQAGVTKVNVHANIDAGGYCWGKYGFMCPKESAIATIDSQLSKGIMSKEQYSQCLEIINDSDGDVCMNKISKLPGAREFMKNASWYGYIDLNNKKQMAYFYSYLAKI